VKVILGLMCGLVILFGGGCVLLAGSGLGIFGLLIFAVVALNAMVLLALFGWNDMPPWPLYVLAAIDLLIAAACVYGLTMVGSGGGYEGVLIIPLVLAACKALLALQVANKR
jgi:hypothetical protein